MGLSGSRAEWTNSCEATVGLDDNCRLRGAPPLREMNVTDLENRTRCAGNSRLDDAGTVDADVFQRGKREHAIRCCADANAQQSIGSRPISVRGTQPSPALMTKTPHSPVGLQQP